MDYHKHYYCQHLFLEEQPDWKLTGLLTQSTGEDEKWDVADELSSNGDCQLQVSNDSEDSLKISEAKSVRDD